MRLIRALVILATALSLSAWDFDPELDWPFGPNFPGIVVPTPDSTEPSPGSESEPETAGSASFSVGWLPPTRNTDGSALQDLAAYEIHYGTQSGLYTSSIRIDNIGLSRYVVTGVDLDTYFVAMRAVNRAGVASDFSAEIARLAN